MAIKGVSMEVSFTIWAMTISAILVLVVIDLLTVSSKPHDVMFKAAGGFFWNCFFRHSLCWNHIQYFAWLDSFIPAYRANLLLIF